VACLEVVIDDRMITLTKESLNHMTPDISSPPCYENVQHSDLTLYERTLSGCGEVIFPRLLKKGQMQGSRNPEE
jgi:hypothetical protein